MMDKPECFGVLFFCGASECMGDPVLEKPRCDLASPCAKQHVLSAVRCEAARSWGDLVAICTDHTGRGPSLVRRVG